MKKSIKLFSKISLASIVLSIFMVSCSSDEGSIFETPDNDDSVATLVINQGDPSNDVFTAKANGEVGTSVPGRVIYTSTDITQRRLYITQNVSGAGDMPFNNFELTSKDLKKALKADGSIDLDGATKKEIDFTFDLPVPNIDNGSIVYSFWTTTGKGDFRDSSKRKALGVGTITVTVGTGTNPAAEVHSYTGIKLFAPDVEGTSETFYSLLNDQEYKVYDPLNVLDQAEYRAFWDFGYYYGASGVSLNHKASFVSTQAYDATFGFPVKGLQTLEGEEDTSNETLNKTYFKTSTILSSEFDTISLSGELDIIVKADEQSVNNLNVGDVIEFVDNYGKKGLIKITEIKAGYSLSDYIVFDVKVQP